jgi:predicted dehydrogenase
VIQGSRSGALREELSYFTRCIRLGERPTLVTPEEARSAVAACLAAERSAGTGTVITL